MVIPLTFDLIKNITTFVVVPSLIVLTPLLLRPGIMQAIYRRIMGHADIDYHYAPSGTIKLRLRQPQNQEHQEEPTKQNSSEASTLTTGDITTTTSTSESNNNNNNHPNPPVVETSISSPTTQVPLSTVIKSLMPPCNLSPFLFNGHLQTISTALKAKDSPPIYYKRRIFTSTHDSYPGSFAVDFVVPPYNTEGRDGSSGEGKLYPRTTYFTEDEWKQEGAGAGSLDRKPMLVVLHGLSGGSHEVYLRHVIAPLVPHGTKDASSSPVIGEAEGGSGTRTEETTDQGLGWEVIVLNARGCARSKITSNILFNARATWDVRQMVSWLREMFPNRPLFGIGFSLGANILTNYLGEEGDECQLQAALIVSNPWNLDTSNVALRSTFIGLHVYTRAMGGNVKRVAEKHAEEISKNTRIDMEAVRKVKFLYEFDRAVQCPTWGYPTEGAYYRDASSIDSIMAIKIPFLALNALDDPISSGLSLPFEEVKQTPYGVMVTTSLGGHLSWFELGGGRWFSKVTTAFLQKLANELDFDNPFDRVDGPDGHPLKRDPLKANFEPMRRKMHKGSEFEPEHNRP